MFTSARSSTLWHRASSSAGLATTTARHRARDTATFSRLRLYRKALEPVDGADACASRQVGLQQLDLRVVRGDDENVVEGGLVDDVDARAHRGERCLDLVREARGAPQAEIGLDLDDARMAGLECLARIPRRSQQGSPAWSITGSEPSLAAYH
jgi:hypothetical protein